MNKTIAIVGGGISGLALLHCLVEKYQLDAGVDIFLLEKNAQVGGTIRTLSQDGVLFETGPNGFIGSSPQTLKFLEDIGLRERIVPASQTAKRRYICRQNRLYALPLRPKELLTFSLLKKRDKLAILAEVFKKGKPDPSESVYAFAKRHFNDNIAELLFDPFVSGVFAGDIRQLNLQAAFPKLYEMEKEYGSILKGYQQTRDKKAGLQSLQNGMGMVTEQMYKKYPSRIFLSETVESMEYHQRDLFIHTNRRDMRVDRLFIAAPAYAAARMVDRIDQLLAESLQKISYAPLVVIGVVFNKEEWIRPVEGFGYLKPSTDHQEVLGVLFEDQIFSSRAPADKSVFRVMIGGAHHPDILQKSQQELTALALNEIRTTLDLKTEPVHVFYQAWPHAIPQYNQNYVETIKKIQERRKQHPALGLLGNYIGGISFNNCVANAHRLAQECTL